MSTEGLSRPRAQRSEVDLRVVPLGFCALIALGTMLLKLPWSLRPERELGFLDALFLSTSAACVTGLSPINVADTFNIFGQAVLLVLIQAGGLGIFTASILLVLLSGNRLSLADEQTIHATMGRLQNVRPLDVFLYASIFVMLLELAGAVAMFCLMTLADPGADPWQLVWEAVFHSVSAFCNAGISIYPEGLVRWRNQPGILLVLSTLVVLGGIGLMTLINLRFLRFWKRDRRERGRLTLQTRLSLMSAGVLLVMGYLFTLGFESWHTLAEAEGAAMVTWPMVHSVMTRTAGFNVVDIGAMNPPTLLFTMGLMFVGGAPGSMAGGIKTVTFVVLLLTAWSALRRRSEVQFFGRRIPARASNVAVMILLLAMATLLLGAGLLMITEVNGPSAATSNHWLALMFESVSAFCTVGLSTGVTPLLTSGGKAIIIGLMFLGRVGPLVLSVYLARPAKSLPVKFPQEELALG